MGEYVFIKDERNRIVGTTKKENCNDISEGFSTISTEQFFENVSGDDKKISEMFKAAGLMHEYNVPEDGEVEVIIHWGDWKHDHGFVTSLMQAIGYDEVDETVTDEDGSDCYSAIHTYKKK